ncbi:MAG: YceI family protein [Chitinophagaceae bacterium]
MGCLKKYSSLVLLLLSVYGAIAQKRTVGNVQQWMIQKASRLQVAGSTNVNKFLCEIKEYAQTDTLIMLKNQQQIGLNGSVVLDVSSFDCHNAMMTHDLRKTMKAKEFPRFYIKFLNLQSLPDLHVNTPQTINGQVNILLSGVERNLTINYQFIKVSATEARLVGQQLITFTEFGLIPPRKLGGMIKAKDELNVIFELHLKLMD